MILFRIESQIMLKSSFILSGLSLGVSILSLLNQLVIAHQFGSSIDLDAYFVSSSVPTFVAGTIVAAFSYSLVPFLLSQKSDYFNVIVSLMTVIIIAGAIAVSVFGYICSNIFLLAKYTQYSKDTIMQVNRLSWLYCFFAIIIGYFVCVLNSKKRFYLPIILSGLPYLGIMLSSLFFDKTFGIITIAIGLLVGTVISCLIMFFVVKKDFTLPENPFININSVIAVFKQLPFVIVGMSCFTIYQSIDAYWAPAIGTSNLAYLSYCQRIIIAIGGLVIAGPSIILVPFLSETLLKQGVDTFLEILLKTIKFTFFICAFVVIILSILAEAIVKILFERGNFDKISVNGVASILPYLAIGMIPMLFVIIFFRAIMLQNREQSSALLGLISIVCYFTLSGLFSGWLKLEGIGLAYIMSWLITMLVAVQLLWRNRIILLINRKNIIDLIKYVVLISIISILTYTLKINIITNTEIVSDTYLFFSVAFIGFVSLIGYLSLSLVLRLSELKLITNKFIPKSI